MKIREIQIQQFGQFDHKIYQFPSHPFLIIYGPNEAGKSTLFEVIKAVLFGFPSKNHLSNYLKDKDIKRLSGSLKIETKEGMRTYTRDYKTNEFLKTYIEQIGHEIDEIPGFKGVDRTFFESIFCFNLDGLRDLHQVKTEDLNQFLFNAGMMGSTELSELEQKLSKKRDELYKRAGRKPEINQLLIERHHKEQQRKQLEKSRKTFSELQNRIKAAKEYQENLKAKKRQIYIRLEEYKLSKTLHPLLVSYHYLKNEEKIYQPKHPFPEQGIERFEKWKTKFVAFEGECAEINEKMKQLKQEMNTIKIDDSLLSMEERIVTLLKSTSKYEHTCEQISSLNDTITDEKQQIEENLRILGPDWSLDRIRQVNTNLETKQDMKRLLHERHRAIEDVAYYEKIVAQRSEELQQIKGRIEQGKSQLMHTTEREMMEREIQRIKNDQDLLKEKEWLEQNSQILQHDHQQNGLKNKGSMSTSLGVFLSLLVGGLLFLVDHVVGMVALALGIIFSICASFLMKKPSSRKDEPDKITQRLNEIIAILNEEPEIKSSYEELSHKLEKDRQLAMMQEMEQKQYETVKKKYDVSLFKLNQAMNTVDKADQAFNEWLKNHGFPSIPLSLIDESFQVIQETQKALNRISYLNMKIDQRMQEKKAYEATKDEIFNSLALNADTEQLEQKLKTEKEKKEKLNNYQQQYHLFFQQKKSLKEKVITYQKECQYLLELACVEDEENFRLEAKRHDKYHELQKKISERYEQILNSVGSKEKAENYISEPIEDIYDAKKEQDEIASLEEIELEEERLNRQLIDDLSRAQSLEQDERYDDVVYDIARLDSNLQEKSRKWAIYQLALTSLNKVKEEYRKTKLPKVLRAAETYFSKMTNQIYTAVFLHTERGFIVRDSKGNEYEVSQLSRGTSEQLYLSIRLALASIVETKEALPIIIDDSLVNFDQERRSQVLSVLTEVSKKHQVILFTCHKEWRHEVSESSFISLDLAQKKIEDPVIKTV
ncbi:AAA family ATPase [Terrilactibacillus sp. BCM23-1]|uniref:AAA family ATPase n=1 Tax=Terrilactibacillus tamarindi TaxID=2599694 RepID=A0A6N8CN09_9BACI|nr:AAA family ATPase [Terrilactibacillus tamarindi]MTT30473.1 AAA family ATPase [Terrilactibacillus tamarindi]